MLAHNETLSQSLSAIRIACDTLDASVALTLASQLDQAYRSGKKAILVDLGAPARCLESGLAGLIDSCARLSANMRIGLCNPGDPLLRQLRRYGLDRAFAVFDKFDTALLDPQFQSFRVTGMKAVVLCAGEGRRMRPMTDRVPKPMLDVAGKPVIARILDHLGRYGLNDITLNPGYLGPQIPDYFRLHKNPSQTIHFMAEGKRLFKEWQAEPLGSLTTLARLNCNHFAFSDDTFVLCGDALIDIDLAEMLVQHRKSDAAVTVACKTVQPDLVSNYGILVVDETGRVSSFQEKPSRDQAQSLLANTGIYLMRPDILQSLQEIPGQDIAADLFPAILKAGLRMQAFTVPFNWSDIGCGRAYYDSVANVLTGNLPGDKPNGEKVAENLWLGPGAYVSPWANITGNCFVGAGARVEGNARIEGISAIGSGSIVEGGAAIRDSIVWPDTHVTATLDRVIAGSDWAVSHRLADGRQDASVRCPGISSVVVDMAQVVAKPLSLAS